MKRFRGRGGTPPFLRIRQPEKGYRFSLDSVLLADFAVSRCGRSVLDLGTGSGVLLLLLAARCAFLRSGVGVEIQEELWRAARSNFLDHGQGGRLSAVLGDLRKDVPGLSGKLFDLVISNPPYGKIGEGRKSPVAQREIARREISCTMADIVSAAAKYMAAGGRFATVSPPNRLPGILSLASEAGIRMDAVRFVHPRAGLPAIRVLVAGSRGGGGRAPEVLAPLVIRAERGGYHPKVLQIYTDFFQGTAAPGPGSIS